MFSSGPGFQPELYSKAYDEVTSAHFIFLKQSIRNNNKNKVPVTITRLERHNNKQRDAELEQR